MADHNKPTLTSNYADFVSELDGRFDDLAKGLDSATTSATNIPVDSIRWSSASNRWEKWNGSSWVILTTGIAMNAEWTAATVDQAEAEAGTATTRRAWTAQRVRQAIAAWWNSVKNIDGKAIGQTTPAAGKFTDMDTTTRFRVLAATGSGYGEIARVLTTGGLSMKCSNGPEVLSFYDFDFPDISTVGGLIRFFRATNTTADCNLNIYTGDGTNTIAHSFTSKSGASFCNNGGVAAFKGGISFSIIRSTAASGSTITLTSNTTQLIYDQAATVDALTVALPSTPINGTVIAISTRSAITALTVSGGTIYGAPTSLTAGGFCQFIYNAPSAGWFRRG